MAISGMGPGLSSPYQSPSYNRPNIGSNRDPFQNPHSRNINDYYAGSTLAQSLGAYPTITNLSGAAAQHQRNVAARTAAMPYGSYYNMPAANYFTAPRGVNPRTVGGGSGGVYGGGVIAPRPSPFGQPPPRSTQPKIFKTQAAVNKSFNQGLKNLAAGKKLNAKQKLVLGKAFQIATATSDGRAAVRQALFGGTSNRNATAAQKKAAKQLIQAAQVARRVQTGRAVVTRNAKGQVVTRKVPHRR